MGGGGPARGPSAHRARAVRDRALLPRDGLSPQGACACGTDTRGAGRGHTSPRRDPARRRRASRRVPWVRPPRGRVFFPGLGVAVPGPLQRRAEEPRADHCRAVDRRNGRRCKLRRRLVGCGRA
eukprot:Amastigsp_a511931_7.p3 type:complete len:124 gc:universal Amastigsp_a511931_7:772-401(-)